MRKGIEGLAALAQDVLRQKPTGGAVFAFRGRRGDRLKLLYFDGQGFCLYYKILQKGRFPWPSAADGTARLTSAQMAMLVTGRLLPRRFCFDAGDEFFVVDKAVEEVVPFLS
ncbi:IS66 family insertion sequence element accessory protein TnpB [Sinorhizobium fredii]|uniref:IS66 family insertion sequence element accessory protein TnpB n=1 Tax=Rhizobium fredii TaxID=380 RepID=UPI0035183DBA